MTYNIFAEPLEGNARKESVPFVAGFRLGR
jgi:hypothetical protein